MCCPKKYINTIPLDEDSPECVLLDKKASYVNIYRRNRVTQRKHIQLGQEQNRCQTQMS